MGEKEEVDREEGGRGRKSRGERRVEGREEEEGRGKRRGGVTVSLQLQQ